MATAARSRHARRAGADGPVRDRILAAAFSAFTEQGFATASMLEIATRARVSKRELYALVGNKQEMLVACIAARARRLNVPADLPAPRDRETLAQILTTFGTRLVHEVSDPTVISVFRLAIAEAVQAPEVAEALDAVGRHATRAGLRQIMTEAQASGLLAGPPDELASQFAGLLWRDLMVGLLLGVVKRPDPPDIARRAVEAATAFLQLHPSPIG